MYVAFQTCMSDEGGLRKLLIRQLSEIAYGSFDRSASSLQYTLLFSRGSCPVQETLVGYAALRRKREKEKRVIVAICEITPLLTTYHLLLSWHHA